MNRRRFILGFVIFAMAGVAGCGAAILYLYHHPATVNRLLEDWLSSRAGASISIGNLSYALDPLQVQATQIHISDGAAFRNLDLRIAKVSAECKLEGPFGRKTLVIDRLDLSGVRMQTEGEMDWKAVILDSGPPSALSWIIKRVSDILFFRHIRLASAALAETDIALRAAGLQLLLPRLQADTTPEGIRVTGGAQLNWTALNAAFDAPRFTATLNLGYSWDQGSINVDLRVPEAVYSGPDIDARLTHVRARVQLTTGTDRLVLDTGHLECEVFKLKTAKTNEVAINSPQMSVAGNFSRKHHVWSLTHWQMSLEETLSIRGEAELTLASPCSLAFTSIEGSIAAGPVMAFFAQAIESNHIPVSLAGSLNISGSVAFQETDGVWRRDGELTAAFSRMHAQWASDSLRLQGVLSGSLRAILSKAAPEISARLNGEDLQLSGADLRMEPFTFEASLEGTYPVFAIDFIDVLAQSVSLKAGETIYAINGLLVRLKNGRLEMNQGTVSFPDVFLSSDLLRNLQGSLAGDRQHIALNLAGSGVGWVDVLEKFKLLPSGWRFDAEDHLKAAVAIRPEGESSLSASIELTNLGFSDPTESYLAEKVSVQANINARGRINEGKIAVDAAASSTGGEILWNRFYIDFNQNHVKASAQLQYAATERQLQVDDFSIELADLLTLKSRGSLFHHTDHTEYDVTLQIPPIPLAPLYAKLVAEPRRFTKPSLGELEVGGLISADLNWRYAGGSAMIRGKSTWEQGRVVSKDGNFRLEGIDLRMPIWVQNEHASNNAAPLDGRISIQKIDLPTLPPQELALPFSVRPNQITTTGKWRILFSSGEIRFGPIQCKEVFSQTPEIKTSLTIDQVQLDPYLRDVWPAPVEGIVRGELEDLAFNGNRISSRGSLILEIFGGRIVVFNPGVEAALNATPVIYADCSIQNLDLSKVTQDTSFGRIRGVLEGHIKNLEIVNRQPQTFVLHLETVRTPGVPQRINLEAVENIARIGGGQSPFAGMAGKFASMFKEFSYAKIGIHALLQNDVFRINGTIREGGVEYLVKKGGIPGVDVINSNPENQISFKDMLKRIQRATEPESAPVIR